MGSLFYQLRREPQKVDILGRNDIVFRKHHSSRARSKAVPVLCRTSPTCTMSRRGFTVMAAPKDWTMEKSDPKSRPQAKNHALAQVPRRVPLLYITTSNH